MKRLLVIVAVLLLSHVGHAQEDIFKPENALSPTGRFYASVIRIFDTDPLNENPYRIAIREADTGKVVGSVISEIEMTDPSSVRETKVIWTEAGNFVAFSMPSDRRTRVTKFFYVDALHNRAVTVSIQDYFQNMLGRIDQVAPPEYYFEEIEPMERDTVRIRVSAGSRDPMYTMEGEAVIQLVGDPHSDPSGRIESISIKEAEPAHGANQP